MSWTRDTRTQELDKLTANRILVLDGAMGTMIQRYKLDEAAYRGDRFANYHTDVAGNNDLLSLSQPDIVRDIHTAYLEAPPPTSCSRAGAPSRRTRPTRPRIMCWRTSRM